MKKIKEFIQLFVPPVYYKVKKRFFLKKEEPHHALPKIEHINQRMIVIGTGPSLNKTIELYEPQLHEADCMMVNFSARTPLFEQIQPQYYLMADPGYMHASYLMESKKALLDALQSKTVWPMTIIMPDALKAWDKCEELRTNENISILFYNNQWSEVLGTQLFDAWDKNIIAPPAQTVLNTAVWLSIYFGYQETYIVGADTSWLEDTHVDQITNRVFTLDTHYYNNLDIISEEGVFNKDRRYLPVKYHEEIKTVYIALKSYWDLKEYADWKGVKVYNASEYSYIDAFERKKLK